MEQTEEMGYQLRLIFKVDQGGGGGGDGGFQILERESLNKCYLLNASAFARIHTPFYTLCGIGSTCTSTQFTGFKQEGLHRGQI